MWGLESLFAWKAPVKSDTVSKSQYDEVADIATKRLEEITILKGTVLTWKEESRLILRREADLKRELEIVAADYAKCREEMAKAKGALAEVNTLYTDLLKSVQDLARTYSVAESQPFDLSCTCVS